jgi:hypothetical protein
MFKASDIKSVKNIKREDGTGWAYYDEGMEFKFPLNFSDAQKKSAKNIKPGEVILLFQRVNKVQGVKDHTYLTHLVTPTDHILSEDRTLGHKFAWIRNVAVVARANPRTAIFTVPSILSFYKPQFGKVCDVGLLNTNRDRAEIQNEIWGHFKGHFSQNLEELFGDEVVPDGLIDEDFSVKEGAESVVTREHLSRERNKVIVGLAKERALAKGNGRIICECCSFDFVARYGDHGYSFIECHHGLPIATGGERITRVEDLHMVCSNCHRMLHRRQPNSIKYHTVSSLKKAIESFSIVR